LLKRQTVEEHRRAVCEIESRSPLYFHGFSGVKEERLVTSAHFVWRGKPQPPGNAATNDTGTSSTSQFFCFWGVWLCLWVFPQITRESIKRECLWKR